MNKQIKSITMALACVCVGLAGNVYSDDTAGIYSDRIVVGQSAAFEGPAKALGLGMRAGLLAAFKEANDEGGVNGRTIEMVTYDDGYEPERAIANTESLINKDKVFVIVGGVGTPTAKAAQPITKAAGVPFIGPFTGAGFLRDPDNSNVINVRGSYDQETEAWISHLSDDLDSKRIAILYQDDSFGRAGLSGVRKAMTKRNMELVAEGTYERNTTAVKSALLKIRKAKPDAVVMVGAYRPIAEFVRLARKLRMNSKFVTISFVGSKALAKELGDVGEGVVVTQVVPFPEDNSLPLVENYRKALEELDPTAEPGFVSLEGYMVGKLFVEAVAMLGKDVTREGLISVFEGTGDFDLGGVILSYGPDDNQGMDEVYMSVLQADGKFQYVENLSD
ncbi:MAG: ABC transporter substrate-binding protein [Granulosicoccus sp.]